MTPEQCRAARRAATAHVQMELAVQPTAVPTQIMGKLVRIFTDTGNTLKLGETVVVLVPTSSLGTGPAAEAWARAFYVEAYLNPAPNGWQLAPGQVTLMRSKTDTPINPADSDSLGITIGPDLWAPHAGAAAIVVSPPTVTGVFRDHWNELDQAKRIVYIVVAILFAAFVLGRLYFWMQPSSGLDHKSGRGPGSAGFQPALAGRPSSQGAPSGRSDGQGPSGNETSGTAAATTATTVLTSTRPAALETAPHALAFYREQSGDAPSGLVFRKPTGPDGAEGEVEGLIECQAKRQLHLSLAFDQSKEPGLTYYGKEWQLNGRPFNLYLNLKIDGRLFNIPNAKIISWQSPMHFVLGAVAFFSDDIYLAMTTAHRINMYTGNSDVTGLITSQPDAMKALADYCTK